MTRTEFIDSAIMSLINGRGGTWNGLDDPSKLGSLGDKLVKAATIFADARAKIYPFDPSKAIDVGIGDRRGVQT